LPLEALGKTEKKLLKTGNAAHRKKFAQAIGRNGTNYRMDRQDARVIKNGEAERDMNISSERLKAARKRLRLTHASKE
jgi:hypothetical protein